MNTLFCFTHLGMLHNLKRVPSLILCMQKMYRLCLLQEENVLTPKLIEQKLSLTMQYPLITPALDHKAPPPSIEYDTGRRLVSMYMAVLFSAHRQNEPSCLWKTGVSLSRLWLTFGLSSVTLCYPSILLNPSMSLKWQRSKELCPIIFSCCVTAPSDRSITNRSTYVLTAATDCCSEDKGHHFLLVPLFCFEVKVSFKFLLVAHCAVFCHNLANWDKIQNRFHHRAKVTVLNTTRVRITDHQTFRSFRAQQKSCRNSN